MHTDGTATDWTQVVALYDQLVRLDPSPIVRLSRAIAVGQRDGLDAGLTLVDALAPQLSEYHAFHASRADLLRRMGRIAEADEAYAAALNLATNGAERAFLIRRREELRA